MFVASQSVVSTFERMSICTSSHVANGPIIRTRKQAGRQASRERRKMKSCEMAARKVAFRGGEFCPYPRNDTTALNVSVGFVMVTVCATLIKQVKYLQVLITCSLHL